jgi:hypothetical protein
MAATTSYDSNAWFEMFRSAFAPMMHLQAEGLNAIDRLLHLQYETAGDYLDAGIAHAHAFMEANSPSDFLRRESALAARLDEKIRDRNDKLVTLTAETQNSVSQAATEATSRSADVPKRATSDAAARAAEARSAEAKATESSRRPS